MVKITKEDFYKLKQLDRIEYRQRKEQIDKRYGGSVTCSITLGIIYWLIGLVAYLLIALPIWKLAFGSEVLKGLISASRRGLMLFELAIFLGIVLDILMIYFYRMKKKELNSDYFKEELIIKHGKDRKR
jgi:hypothetical protein